MRVINESSGNGLYSKMIEKQYYDVVLKIENEEVKSIKSILCVSNYRLESIIRNEKAESPIPLPDQITKKAFSLLCEYYGFGIIDINEENVSELLLCCICLDEVKLIAKCRIFILKHLNNKLAIDILNMMADIPDSLNDIKTVVSDYIRLYCISILKDENVFKTLNLENFKYMMTLENILIPSEKYLLNKILKHYHENTERIEDKKEKYNEVMKYLNWNEIDTREIDRKDKNIIDFNIMNNNETPTQTKRKYGRTPHTSNQVLDEMILNGFKNIDQIKDMYYEDCEYLTSHKEELIEEISEYLTNSKCLIQIITILRIMKKLNIKKNELKLNKKEIEKLTKLLIELYKINEEERILIIECLSHFFDNESIIEHVRFGIENSILSDILNCENTENKSSVIKFIRNSLDEDERKSIVCLVKSEEIKQKILPKQPQQQPQPPKEEVESVISLPSSISQQKPVPSPQILQLQQQIQQHRQEASQKPLRKNISIPSNNLTPPSK